MTSLNWTLVLGIDFDPVSDDSAYIREVIEQKYKDWSISSTRGDDPGYYTNLLENKSEIDKIAENKELRQKLAEEAKSLVKGEINKSLRKFQGDGVIPSKKITAICKIVKREVEKKANVKAWECSEEYVEKCALEQGFKLDSNDEKHAEEVNRAFAPFDKGTRYSGFKDPQKRLKLLGYDDVYAYARESNPSITRSSLNKEILKCLQNNFEKRSGKIDQAKDNAEKVLNFFKDVFSSSDEREKYDNYLTYLEVKAKLEDFKSDAELNNKHVDIKTFQSATSQIAPLIKNKADAPLIVEGYCNKNKFIRDSISGKVFCRCGHCNDKQNVVCAGCGLPLNVECPNCGKKLANGVEMCPTCAHEIGKALDRAKECCDKAKESLDDSRISEAKIYIEKAKEEWPTLSIIADIKEDLDKKNSQLEPLLSRLQVSINEKKFESAKKCAEEIKKLFPRYEVSQLDEIEFALAALNNKLSTITESSTEEQKIRTYSEALELCHDCEEALFFMKFHAPCAPCDVCAQWQASSNSVKIEWKPSGSEGSIKYIVVKKEGAPPTSIDDGLLVLETTAYEGDDQNPQQGASYYYAVFAERFNGISKPCFTKKSVFISSEVSNLEVRPTDKAIKLKWDHVNGGKVVVLMTSPESKVLGETSLDEFICGSLENGVTYEFNIVVEYIHDGDIIRTAGVSRVATPIDNQVVIKGLHAKRKKGSDSFLLNWSVNSNAEIRFFLATTLDEIPDERSIRTLEELLGQFKVADVSDVNNSSATLTYNDQRPIFVFPAVVCGESAIVGKWCKISITEDVKIIDVTKVNDYLRIRIEPNEKASQYLILSRKDRFVNDISECNKDVKRKQVSIASFERDGVLKLNEGGEQDVYISVFANYGTPQEPDYSEGSDYLFCEEEIIKYSIISKKRWFAPPQFSVSFRSSSGNKFVLPKTYCRLGRDSVPLAGAGEVIKMIDSREVDGEYVCELGCLPKEKNLFLKAECEDGETVKLQLDESSNHQIS